MAIIKVKAGITVPIVKSTIIHYGGALQREIVCPFCDAKHVHGLALGYRLAHCRTKKAGREYTYEIIWIGKDKRGKDY